MVTSRPEQEAAERAQRVRKEVGHPQERWSALIERVQAEKIREFTEVMTDYLALMWCLDRYRVADAPPLGMGDATMAFRSRMDGIYRGKGNQFANLLSLLLDNRTGQKIRSRSKIVGYSQLHQIDLAWPDREIAPIVCAESKVTGGPAYRDNPERGAMADWSNRRKELKFAATDLKLARREQTTKIGHWSYWRASAAPKTFMLWGARLRPQDKIENMARETEALLATYMDGAGIFAWREAPAGDGYVPTPLPRGSRVETIDEALWRIEEEIAAAVASGASNKPVELAEPIDPYQLDADFEGSAEDE
jgi:hypothetical protein